MLRFGNKIRLSEDGLSIYSEVDGHVSLVDGRVFVSDTFEVPPMWTPLPGISSMKETWWSRKCHHGVLGEGQGDIEVYGVVEGAYLEAGGQIILRRGMRG